ncbi:uncharacterized protein LOC135156776 [Lytechinus pictus]|uniref:uncharacterized protein LOC135156776 n=1 Tax=Lytechinus pictus TaxID=7653 RepID=UPI0030B9C2B5
MVRPVTRSNPGSTGSAQNPCGSESGAAESNIPSDRDAGHSTESRASEKGIQTSSNLLQKSIVDALCAEETRKRLVDAIVDVIVDNVTQSVYDAVKLDLEHQKSEITSLSKKVDELRKEITSLKSSCEIQEQYSRRSCLRFHGIPEKEDENTDEVIRQVVNEKLDINLTSTDIDRSHRLTSRSGMSEGAKPRVIIMKFARYNIRKMIYSNRAKLKGTKIFIHEDLTRHRQSLVNAANKSDLISKVYTTDGRVKALVKATQRCITITSENQIEKL